MMIIVVSTAAYAQNISLSQGDKLIFKNVAGVNDGTYFVRTNSDNLDLNYKGTFVLQSLDNSPFQFYNSNNELLFDFDPSKAWTYRFYKNVKMDEKLSIGQIWSDSKFAVLFDTSTGNRSFRTYDNLGVRLQREGDASSWDFSYGFLSNDASVDWRGFGAYGSGNSSLDFYYIGKNHNYPTAVFTADGKVGMGSLDPDHELDVRGTIHAKEVIVNLDVPADYVFDENYPLTPLNEVEAHIKSNHHLPGIPSANEIKEQGWLVGEMSNKLLEKVEELTLYIIEQNKKNQEQETRIKALEETISKLKSN
ncbi:MAG: hypothetical protein ACMVP2_16480 [Imperialibacter sp.]|uniref:hypothetical protein n=1 Tax=Imperialibacter sp. TaxID=2038411 RepID=UPI0030D9B789|tara:strand:- start:86 stop:1006 length:921 start_codon:yes stop_codon:yes gene_type:complete